ncbi:MAG TPA: PAS domain-containing sensor histidine kinase [Rhizomicrobium sp.]
MPQLLIVAIALAGAGLGYAVGRGVFARREGARAVAEQRYRVIAEEASDIVVLHENNKIVFTSGAMKRLLDRTPQEFEAGKYLNIVHPDDLEEAGKVLGQPVPGETRHATYRVRHADGHYVWFEVSTRAVYNQAGEFVQEISVGRDITERKRQEAEVVAAQERAEAANRAKSFFLAIMSHELRTPLNAVIGFSDILKGEMFGPVGNARYKDYVEGIHSSGRHLLGVINDILDMTKLDTDQLALERQTVDVSEVVGDCAGYIATLAKDGGVTLAVDVPGLRIDADPTRLRQVVLNLLSNAVKFSHRGGHVQVTAREEGGQAILTIRDSGIGMKAEDIPIALERFGQIDSALNRRYEGVGLGLPLTKQLVELHGGTLAIVSAQNEGTTVRVTLPGCRPAGLRAVA